MNVFCTEGVIMAYIMRDEHMEYPTDPNIPIDYRWRQSKRLKDVANAKQMLVKIILLDSNQFSYPYHFHYNAEELFVILSGSALLRTPEGFQEVS